MCKNTFTYRIFAKGYRVVYVLLLLPLVYILLDLLASDILTTISVQLYSNNSAEILRALCPSRLGI